MRDGIGPSSLIEICLRQAASSIKTYDDVSMLSEELALCLFGMVIENGKLTPKVLSVRAQQDALANDSRGLTKTLLHGQLFKTTDHEALLKQIDSMGIKDTPPLAEAQRPRWLHESRKF